MKTEENLRLVWSEFQSSTTSFLSQVRESHNFSDVTLVCNDYQLVPGHRLILSAGSRFFESVLTVSVAHPNPLVYLKGVSKDDLVAILLFLYTGETQIQKTRLEAFLILARDLGIKGLSEEDQVGARRDTEKEAEEEEDEMEQILRGELKNIEHLENKRILKQINTRSDEERPRKSRKGQPKNPVWEYFTKDPENEKRAICQIPVEGRACDVECYAKNKTTSNMLRHMMTKHLGTFTEMKDNMKYSMKDIKEDPDAIASTIQHPFEEDQNRPINLHLLKENLNSIDSKTSSPLTEKKFRSPVWNSFTRDPEDRDRAICHVCNEAVNAKNTTTMMLKHIQKKHGEEINVALAI